VDDGIDIVFLEDLQETRDIKQLALNGNDIGAGSVKEIPVEADRCVAGVGQFVDDVAAGESGTARDQDRTHVVCLSGVGV
jgi:hypothetical protein